MTAVMFAFVVGEHAKVRCEPEEFVLCQAKLPSPGMVMPEIILDGKRFVDQDAIRFQRLDQPRKEWAMEIEEHQNDIISTHRKFRSVVAGAFQVDHAHAHVWKIPSFRRCREFGQSLFIAIERIDLEAM